MKKLKAFVLCALLTPYTVFASVNGINNDNNGYDINGNTCMMNTGNADINDALAAQNPACHMGNKTFNLNSNALGATGPLSVSTQYSDEFGVVVNAKFTHSITNDNAISFELDYGENENRFGITWAHFLNSQNRVKLTVERLQQKLDFNFDSGNVSKRVPQYAVGGVYQYLIEEGMVTHLELGVYYAKATSEELDTKNYMSGGDEYINYRHIAGAKSKGLDFSIGLVPWETGNVKITMNYDQVRYDQKYDKIDADDTQGFGAGVTLSQLLTDRLKLNLSASAREIYNLYEAKLLWLVPTTNDSQLELGLNVSRNEGHGTTSDNRIGLTASYLWDGSYSDSGYSMPGSVKMGSLVSWAANPAVHMAQVLATADQRSVLVPVPAPMSPMFFMRMFADTSIDVNIMAGELASINVMNYVPVSNPALVTVHSDNIPDNFNLTYDDATGLLAGTPSTGAVSSFADVPVAADVQDLDPESPVYNVNLHVVVNDETTSPVPWANQGFRYNKIVVKSYTDSADVKITDFTFDRGDKYGTAINSDDMFIYPRTGFSDYGVQSNFADFPGDVTCDGCETEGRGDVTLHFKASQDYAQDEPYLVRIYPTNHNYNQYGPGSPQIIKVKVDFADPFILWKENAINLNPINTTKIEASWAEDAAVEKTEPSTPITYTAVLDQTAEGATCSSTNTSFTCENLEPSKAYSVTVTASDVLSDGRMAEPVSQTSDDVTTYTGIVWDSPRNVMAAPVESSTTSALVTWGNTATTEDGWTLNYIVSYLKTDTQDTYHEVAVLPSSATSQLVPNLEPGVQYTFKVEAVDDHDSKPIFGRVDARTNAGFTWAAGVSAEVVQGKTDQVNLTWDGATSDVGVVHYTVTYTVNDEQPVTLPSVDSPALGQPVNDLAQDADVTFTVTASVDDQDGESAQIVSEPVVVHTNYSLRWAWEEPMAAAPVIDSLDSIVVSWEESAESTVSTSVHYVLHYSINGEDQGPVDLTENPYTVSGLTQNTAITNVHVDAVDGVSSPVSSNVVDTKVNAQLVWGSSATVVATAIENTTNQVRVTWDDNATTEVGVDSLGYVLHYTVDGVEQPGVEVASGSYPLTLKYGVNSVTDLYIEARDTISPNVKSNVIDLVQTHTGMTWAADVTAVVVDGKTDQVDLSWSDANSDVGDVTYTVDYTVKGEQQEPIVINAPEHSVSVPALAQDADVSFSVTATVDNQDGVPYHVIAETVLVHTNYALRWPALDTTSVTASTVEGSSTSIHLEWGGEAQSSFTPISYVLTYTVGESDETVSEFDGTATSFDIVNLAEGATVRNIVITAHDAATDAVSPDVSSVPVSQTANQPLVWEDVRASVTATTNTVGSLDVSWENAASDVGNVVYKIYASKDGIFGGTPDATVDGAAPNSTALPDLDLGELYYVKVVATDGVSTITSDPVVSATTYHGAIWTNPIVTAAAVENTSDSVDVTWSGDEFKNDLGTMQFRVEYKEDASGYQQYGELFDANARSVKVTGLHSNTHYTVRVTLVNGVQADDALPSANDDATTNVGLTWIGSVSATVLNAKQARLTWPQDDMNGVHSDFDATLAYTYSTDAGSHWTDLAPVDGSVVINNLVQGGSYPSVQVRVDDGLSPSVTKDSNAIVMMAGISGGMPSVVSSSINMNEAEVHYTAQTDTGKNIVYTVLVAREDSLNQPVTIDYNSDPVSSGVQQTAAISGLSSGTAYTVTVTVKEDEANQDAASAVIDNTSEPFTTRYGLTWSGKLSHDNLTTQTADLHWTQAGDDIPGATVTYDIKIDGESFATNIPWSTQGGYQYRLTGLSLSEHTVKVSVKDDKGSDPKEKTDTIPERSSVVYCPTLASLKQLVSDNGDLNTASTLSSGGKSFTFNNGTSSGITAKDVHYVDAALDEGSHTLYCGYSDKAPDVPDFTYKTVFSSDPKVEIPVLKNSAGFATSHCGFSGNQLNQTDCYVQL